MASSSLVPIPTIDELAARAEALLPRLQERAARAEELRRVPDETIEDFRQAGFFRLFQPRRYGGYELDYGLPQIELGRRLGRACGSSAWVQSVVACHAWLLGMFPAAAQDAVWGSDPDTLLSTGISMRAAKGRPVDGGYHVEGRWEFSSGIDAVQWVMLLVPVETSAGPPDMRFCVLPQSDWEIVDTWYAAGLQGTGSKDVVVNGAFVPEAHSLGMAAMNSGQVPGSAVNGSYIYRLPLMPVFPYNIGCPALGIARGAIEDYITQTVGRPDKLEQAARHLRIAESSAEADAAETLLRADAAEIKRLGEAGVPVPMDTRVRWLRNLSFAALLCQRAVDRVATAASAHSMYEPSAIHRASRDMHAIVNHIGLAWDTWGVSYGRVRVGLDPANPLLGPPGGHHA
jgi:3-hydroxy-9,10-secoandrosta-1,3,5(10)-triene-9,17-dione monooxygenase